MLASLWDMCLLLSAVVIDNRLVKASFDSGGTQYIGALIAMQKGDNLFYIHSDWMEKRGERSEK